MALVPALRGLVGCAALLVAGWLAVSHPLWAVPAFTLLVIWVAATAWQPGLWLFVLPAVLPLMNFAPWTGWIAFDEFDMLVLGAIAGEYLRWASQPPNLTGTTGGGWRDVSYRGLAVLLGSLAMLGVYRGLADAGLQMGWYQGYAEPTNTLRVVKPMVYALLLWPLLRGQLRASIQRSLRRLSAGVLAGLSVVVLAVLWERAAFPGLWDFSTTYRTTALFWEMHVGGAAIDAYLAMAMPFVAWALWSAKSPWQWGAAAALALVAFYACLTTFSRGVYLAVALPMLLLGLVLLARRLDYRVRAMMRRALAYGLLTALTAAALFVALQAFGTIGVVAMLVLALALMAALRRRLTGWRAAASMGLALALMLEVVAVFGTGNFMTSRLVASDRDFGSRLAHWGNGLSLLYSPVDWVWGIGLGRLPASYARFVPDREFPGAVQWVDAPAGHQALLLFGPKTQPDLAGLFALTQRLPLKGVATYRLEFDSRVLARARLAVSVCEIHLLYEGRCQSLRIRLRPGETSWQHHDVVLRGPPLAAGAMSAPRLRVFALSSMDAGTKVEIDNLRLFGDASTNLLHNGDFSRQLAHWLPAAQYYFLPWHIDSLYLEWLIERGLTGLAAFMAVATLALWNLLAGPGRHYAIAPFLAASLGGALTVGLVSSLMDVPRVALLFLLLLFVAMSLNDSAAAQEDAR